jgi:hypothetical protein
MRVSRVIPLLSRGLHASAPRAAGGYDYLHAKHMYQFRNKPGRKGVVGGLVCKLLMSRVGYVLRRL